MVLIWAGSLGNSGAILGLVPLVLLADSSGINSVFQVSCDWSLRPALERLRSPPSGGPPIVFERFSYPYPTEISI